MQARLRLVLRRGPRRNLNGTPDSPRQAGQVYFFSSRISSVGLTAFFSWAAALSLAFCTALP